MVTAASEQRRIVEMLARIYEEIRVVEIELGLSVGKGDYRPRIDYFHDAVRAFTRGDALDTGRLSIEFLAYDISALRYVHGMPLSPLSPGHHHLSPSVALVPHGAQVNAKPRKPARSERVHLADCYQKYAVLFSALLKPVADNDFRDRAEEMQEQAERLSVLFKKAELLGQGKASEQDLREALLYCEEADVQAVVEKLLHKQQYKKAPVMAGALGALKGSVQKADRAIAGLEAAQMQFATAQLGIYEQSKEFVKQMAGAGINLAGRFVEASLAQEQRDRGR